MREQGLQVWLAVDLLGGKAVRLERGQPETAWIVSDDPVALAQGWVTQGGRRLHVVDLDAALGTGNNRQLIRALCETVPVPVQVGGGVRDAATYFSLRELGAQRVVVGSWAVKAPQEVSLLSQRDPQGLVVAGDVKQGRVAVRGWQATSEEGLWQFARKMAAMGVGHLLVTGIERDGTGQGPDLALLRQALAAFGPGVLASGGVGGREHLEALQALIPEGLEGVVVGAALARGQVTLTELMAFEDGERKENLGGSLSYRSVS